MKDFQGFAKPTLSFTKSEDFLWKNRMDFFLSNYLQSPGIPLIASTAPLNKKSKTKKQEFPLADSVHRDEKIAQSRVAFSPSVFWGQHPVVWKMHPRYKHENNFAR